MILLLYMYTEKKNVYYVPIQAEFVKFSVSVKLLVFKLGI